ncbi:MAG: ROK family protein [Candidatus Izemoplasmataceae bacterium]
MESYIYAIDVGGTTIKLARFTADGTLEETFSIKTNHADGGDHVFDDLAKAIRKKTPDLKSVLGIGMGVPGPVKDATVYTAVNVGWGEVDIAKRMKEALNADIPVYVENDVNLAAIGEFHEHKSIRSMVLIALGTGIGGGVIINGEIHAGHNGAAGEFGHMKLRTDGPKCNCGNIGCFETLASAKAIRTKAEAHIRKGRKTIMKKSGTMNAKVVFDAAKSGDELALEIVDKACYYIARAIQIITTAYDPEAIYIGGGMSKAGDFLIGRIIRHYKKIAFKNLADTPIHQATLVERANIYGGYALVKYHG